MENILSYAQENSGSGSTFSSIMAIASVVGLWMMFQKANEPGWTALIPFYNLYKLCEKTMGNPWYWVRFFVIIIPVVGWVAYFYFRYQMGKAIARSFGQPESWAWGYTFLEGVFYCITGFGQYSYYGVMGSGDTRTGEARGAKTVDFDVTKNEAPAAEPAAPEAKAEESNVDFSFEQNDSEAGE